MNTTTNQELRPLTAEEIDAVEGGTTVSASFRYGNFAMAIVADESGYTVCSGTTGGGEMRCVTTEPL